jgi:hypothetical protein
MYIINIDSILCDKNDSAILREDGLVKTHLAVSDQPPDAKEIRLPAFVISIR